LRRNARPSPADAISTGPNDVFHGRLDRVARLWNRSLAWSITVVAVFPAIPGLRHHRLRCLASRRPASSSSPRSWRSASRPSHASGLRRSFLTAFFMAARAWRGPSSRRRGRQRLSSVRGPGFLAPCGRRLRLGDLGACDLHLGLAFAFALALALAASSWRSRLGLALQVGAVARLYSGCP